MKIYNGIEAIDSLNNAIITIGSFDGIHVAHQLILEELCLLAKSNNRTSLVVTFFPHPRMVLSPEDNFTALTTQEEKIEMIEKIGVDVLLIIPFTKQFSELSYQDFIQLLSQKIEIKEMVLGYDHTFGKGRHGNGETLKTLANQYHFNIVEITKQSLKDSEISSSAIRKAIESGKISNANEMLGYSYHAKVQIIEKNNQNTFEVSFCDKIKTIPFKGKYKILINNSNGELEINDKENTIFLSEDKIVEKGKIYDIYFI